jgi:hypothetical protein
MGNKIPCIATHRSIGLHDYQTDERLDRVRAAIDAVYDIRDLDELYEYACSFRNPAEARLFAKARIVAAFETRASGHEHRGNIDMDRLNANTCCLDSLNWTDTDRYFGGPCDPMARAPGVLQTIERRPAHHVHRLLKAREAARGPRRASADMPANAF